MKTKPRRSSCTWSIDGGDVIPVSGTPLEADELERYLLAELREKLRRHRGEDVRAEHAEREAARAEWRRERDAAFARRAAGDREGAAHQAGAASRRYRARLLAIKRPLRRPIAVAPRVSQGAFARPREHRRSPARQARTGPGDDDGSDEPPLTPRCAGCGEAFVPRRPSQRYHDAACGNRARQRAWKARERGSARTDERLRLYAAAVAEARRAGELDADEALELLASPSPRVLELLAAELGAAP
jgi:hypothetical protein